MERDRRDDALHAVLDARGWHSRRAHGQVNGYRPGFDAWGWGGAYPGGIDIRVIGPEHYEASWRSDGSSEPVVEMHRSRAAMIARAEELEHLTDVVPN